MKIYVTACGKKDGLGSQLTSKILAILFCKKHDYEYVHTSFDSIEYKYRNEIQDKVGYLHSVNGTINKWINSWEGHINLCQDYKHVDSIKYDKIFDITDVLKSGQITMNQFYLTHDFDPNEVIIEYIKNLNCDTVLFKVKEFPKLDKYKEEFCSPVFTQLRNNYNLTPKPNLLFDKSKFNIVFHKRHTGPYTLKNDTNLNAFNNRVTLNNYFIKIMNKLNNKYDNVHFWIFSDGSSLYFPEYEFIDDKTAKVLDITVNMMLNTDSQEAFHHFVNADILVTDKSSFGYSAAMYNTNTVIYTNYWDKKYSKWILANEI